jgi:IclR family acetate operon transcriptional repressor
VFTDLRARARPLLERLQAGTGETATLSLPAGGAAVTADFVPSAHSVLSQASVGRVSVAHATATGKVVLAFVPGALAALPAPLERFTDATITDREALAAEVARARASGYAEAAGEREQGLCAIAAPVLDAGAALVAVLGVQGPDRFDAAARAAALPLLRAASGELGAALGGR